MSWFTEHQDAIKNKENAIAGKITSLKPRISGLLGTGFNLGLSADLDAAVRVILDDSFLKVINRTTVALNSTIDKTSKEVQQLIQQIFGYLCDLEKQIEHLIDRCFQNLSSTIQDVKTNLVEPIISKIQDLEKQIFEDINQILDKVFNYFDGKAEELKLDIIKNFGSLLIPNPFDSCRNKYNLGLTPGFNLVYTDVFNLFECKLLKRLDDNKTNVREIKETYATLQLQSFRMTCLGRGSPAFQKIYMDKWLDYGQLFEIWQEFADEMTPQEAYNEAIKKLNQARNEYQAKIAELNCIQNTVNDALGSANDATEKANNAESIASAAIDKADAAFNRASDAMSRADDAFIYDKKIALQSVHGGHLSDRNDDNGDARFVNTIAAWEEFTVIRRL